MNDNYILCNIYIIIYPNVGIFFHLAIYFLDKFINFLLFIIFLFRSKVFIYKIYQNDCYYYNTYLFAT